MFEVKLPCGIAGSLVFYLPTYLRETTTQRVQCVTIYAQQAERKASIDSNKLNAVPVTDERHKK